MAPYTMRVPRKCTPSCYQKRVLPVLTKKHVSNYFPINKLNALLFTEDYYRLASFCFLFKFLKTIALYWMGARKINKL